METQAYTIAEAVIAYSIGRSTLYEQIAAGNIQAKKVGNRIVIPADSLRAWFDALPKAQITTGQNKAKAGR
jgi:excisionase family DNA binding protein